MRKKDDAPLLIWLLSAVVFFALVILYFLGPRILNRGAAQAPPPKPAPAFQSVPAASPLPTAAVRMKIKRIERRKYRREGDSPPPPAVR